MKVKLIDYELINESEYNNTELVKSLIKNGANINFKNDEAFKWLAYNDNIEVINILLIEHNMYVQQDTINHLKKICCDNVVKIIETRNLSNKLLSTLKPKTESKQTKKVKI